MAVAGPATTITTQLSSQMKSYYDRMFLEVLEKTLRYDQFSYKRNIPVHEGDIIVFNRYLNFPAKTTSLTEGTVSASNVLSSELVSATVVGYGDHILLSDLVQLTAIDPKLKGSIPRLAYQAALTIDSLVRNEVRDNGTQVFVSTAQALTAIIDTNVLLADHIKDNVRALRAGDVMPVDAEGNYVLLVHPNTAYDLMTDVSAGGWLDITKYTSKPELFKGEVGKIGGARVLESSNVDRTTSGISAGATAAYYNTLIGHQAYASVGLQQGNLKLLIKPTGSAGAADPIDQIGSAGWKVYFVAKVLDSARVRIIISGSAN